MGIYEDLGLTPIINASGSVTRLGGAPMPPEVLKAFHEAALDCVPLEQLQARASGLIAEATGAEAGLVTAGAAASLTLGTAAILAGFNFRKMEQLPNTDGFPNEFIVAREQRNGYDHAVRAAGAKLVEVGFNEIVANAGVRRTEVLEYQEAFGPNTAGILYVHGPDCRPDLGALVEAAHRSGLPVLVDAAGELPPRSNLRSLVATGADLVAFSGGKAIRGPQSTGILCGRQELIASAALQMLDMDDHFELWDPPSSLFHKELLGGLPRHGIGRGFKVSKEEIAAFLAALKLYTTGTYDQHLPGYRKCLETIAAELKGCPVECRIVEKGDGESLPLLEIRLDERTEGRTAMEVCGALRKGQPPIYVGHQKLFNATLVINPLHLDEEKSLTLARRIRQELAG
jgi:L-seryl-tRNA(Ser) seleniumtransferase